jgi:hypothetical protein
VGAEFEVGPGKAERDTEQFLVCPETAGLNPPEKSRMETEADSTKPRRLGVYTKGTSRTKFPRVVVLVSHDALPRSESILRK